MISTLNIEKNAEKSGRIHVSGWNYYGVKWLKLLRKTITSTVFRLALGAFLAICVVGIGRTQFRE